MKNAYKSGIYVARRVENWVSKVDLGEGVVSRVNGHRGCHVAVLEDGGYCDVDRQGGTTWRGKGGVGKSHVAGGL